MTEQSQEPSITLPISKFLRILFRENTFDTFLQTAEVDPDIALLLDAIDSQSETIWIEPTLPDANSKIANYNVWRKANWTVAYEKWCRDKKRSEDNRQRIYVREENIEKLARAIIVTVPSFNTDEARSMASKLIFAAGEDYQKPRYLKIKASLQQLYQYNLRDYKPTATAKE